MKTTELKEQIIKLLDRVDNQEVLNKYYNYLKEATSEMQMNKLLEHIQSIYSYKQIPEEGTQEAPDFITQVEKGLI